MIEKKLFGTCDKGEVYAYTLSNETGLSATILTLGGILQKLVYRGTDVTLGYDTLEEYLVNSGHFGAIIGRVANRIAGAELTVNGICYPLSVNRVSIRSTAVSKTSARSSGMPQWKMTR